ncbi:hypothetical protein [Flammeovirga sp. EKP202]|uniref:hypothetical protein n=1 Tax=Flammeovirga sp. EKP202 TaxID=2770592 RepID=UPI00165F1BD8|nr:hypothetical protein [Flammeovirga sp. EKP202]MBD0402789.1 hypothetical protein [Flammeovirga sp. EKP202]
MQLISSFAQFLEEKSDKSIYPDQYHFDFAFKIKQIGPTESIEYYILTSEKEEYFAMTSQLEGNDVIIFDIKLNQMIVVCHLDSSQYAICGPLSFFDSNKSISEKYNFIENEPNVFVDHDNKLEIVLTQDSKFNNYGLKKGFWMIIQESSSLETPLSEKGIILRVKKMDDKSNKSTSYTVNERNDININYSIKMSKLLDFSILSDSSFQKQKD